MYRYIVEVLSSSNRQPVTTRALENGKHNMEVDLGFAEEPENVAWLTNRYYPSKLGGHPAWLELEKLPETSQLQCKKCQAPQAFLCQLYAAYEDEFNFHRTIYVFVCRNADCQKPNNAE